MRPDLAFEECMLKRQVDLGFPSASVLENNMQADDGWNVRFMRIGHAGAAAHAPANSLKSLALALELGMDMVEFDVRPCRDALVLLHDDDLSHISNRPGLVSQQTLDELRKIDLGGGERIATLAEAVDLIKDRALMNVDLKAEGIESDVVELLERKDVLGDALISSLRPDSLKRVRQRAPTARMGISYPEDRAHVFGRAYLKPAVTFALWIIKMSLPYRILRLIASAQANGTMLNRKVVSRATVRKVHEARGRVFVWTVEDRKSVV